MGNKVEMSWHCLLVIKWEASISFFALRFNEIFFYRFVKSQMNVKNWSAEHPSLVFCCRQCIRMYFFFFLFYHFRAI